MRKVERLDFAQRPQRAISDHSPWFGAFRQGAHCGHHVAQDTFSQDILRKLLANDQPISLYCAICKESWTADEAQRHAIAWALENTT